MLIIGAPELHDPVRFELQSITSERTRDADDITRMDLGNPYYVGRRRIGLRRHASRRRSARDVKMTEDATEHLYKKEDRKERDSRRR
jgi:hypothetical protein